MAGFDPLDEVEKNQAQLREAIEQTKALAAKAEKLVQEVRKADSQESA